MDQSVEGETVFPAERETQMQNVLDSSFQTIYAPRPLQKKGYLKLIKALIPPTGGALSTEIYWYDLQKSLTLKVHTFTNKSTEMQHPPLVKQKSEYFPSGTKTFPTPLAVRFSPFWRGRHVYPVSNSSLLWSWFLLKQ